MWNWIADEIEMRKKVLDIVDLKLEYCVYNDLYLKSSCFCCEYNNGIYTCEHCPLMWGEFNTCCNNTETGMYDRVVYTSTWQVQAEIARQIANLPERKF